MCTLHADDRKCKLTNFTSDISKHRYGILTSLHILSNKTMFPIISLGNVRRRCLSCGKRLVLLQGHNDSFMGLLLLNYEAYSTSSFVDNTKLTSNLFKNVEKNIFKEIIFMLVMRVTITVDAVHHTKYTKTHAPS